MLPAPPDERKQPPSHDRTDLEAELLEAGR